MDMGWFMAEKRFEQRIFHTSLLATGLHQEGLAVQLQNISLFFCFATDSSFSKLVLVSDKFVVNGSD